MDAELAKPALINSDNADAQSQAGAKTDNGSRHGSLRSDRSKVSEREATPVDDLDAIKVSTTLPTSPKPVPIANGDRQHSPLVRSKPTTPREAPATLPPASDVLIDEDMADQDDSHSQLEREAIVSSARTRGFADHDLLCHFSSATFRNSSLCPVSTKACGRMTSSNASANTCRVQRRVFSASTSIACLDSATSSASPPIHSRIWSTSSRINQYASAPRSNSHGKPSHPHLHPPRSLPFSAKFNTATSVASICPLFSA